MVVNVIANVLSNTFFLVNKPFKIPIKLISILLKWLIAMIHYIKPALYVCALLCNKIKQKQVSEVILSSFRNLYLFL